MAKTRSQTGKISMKKEEEEDCKDNLLLNGDNNATKKGAKIVKRKASKRHKRPLPALQVKVEEDTDTKSLLQASPEYSNPQTGQHLSQEQINQFIDAIVNDKISIAKAARKVNMSLGTAQNYYNKYKNHPEKKVPSPMNKYVHATQEQIGNLIRHIVDDKLSIKAAAAKQDIRYNSGLYYYKKYVDDPGHGIPILHSDPIYTQDQKNGFIGYIVNDKMLIVAASKKAKMSASAAYGYYHNYFDDRNSAPSHIAIPKYCTQEQIKQVISYIVNDKMTIRAASKKANMIDKTVGYHYHQYLKDNNMELPVSKFRKRYTQDQIDDLIGHIVDGKMSINEASKRVSISPPTVKKYYQKYRMDQKRDAPS